MDEEAGVRVAGRGGSGEPPDEVLVWHGVGAELGAGAIHDYFRSVSAALG